MRLIFLFIYIITLSNLSVGQEQKCSEHYLDLGEKNFVNGDYETAESNFFLALNCENSDTVRVFDFLENINVCKKLKKEADAYYNKGIYKLAEQKYQSVLNINEKDVKSLELLDVCKKRITVRNDMVFVPMGSFFMGSESGEMNEEPVHEVLLDSFYMDRFEVSNQDFVAFLNSFEFNLDEAENWIKLNNEKCMICSEDSVFFVKKGFWEYPVSSVTWFGANEYAIWIGKKLPTEAQWEYAASFSSDNERFSGSNNLDEIAWYRENTEGTQQQSGLKKSNNLGIYDMTGNVWEWCMDSYFPHFYSMSPDENPFNHNDSDYKVVRGGGVQTFIDNLYVTYRNFKNPYQTYSDFGFRCVKIIVNRESVQSSR